MQKTFSTDEGTIKFLEEFCCFESNRVYILLAMARPKENEDISSGDEPVFREIVEKSEDIRQKYNKLKSISQNYTAREGAGLNFRLYVTVNARNVRDSMYMFQRQLINYNERITNGHAPAEKKIKRLDKQWKSTLQKDVNKEDNYFIIDIDTKDESIRGRIADALDSETEIIKEVSTPNGYHIITEPFNYTDCEVLSTNEDAETKSDGLLFLKYF
jgi:hypothetical protein